MSKCIFCEKKHNDLLNKDIKVCKILIECKCLNCKFYLTKQQLEEKEEKVKEWFERKKLNGNR